MDNCVMMHDKPLETFREALADPGTTILQAKRVKDPVFDFACSTASALRSLPRQTESRFLYDARGSELFELITKQPEYYLTSIEAELLEENAKQIREATGAVTLVELGSGSSVKTDYLLRAWLAQDLEVRYIPVDVSKSALQTARRSITATHPAVQLIGINSSYQDAFPLLRETSPVMALFLGSSIGNFAPDDMFNFLRDLSAALLPGDFFLLGVDLVKEPGLIHAAYNDAAGISAEFTRNLFVRMNRELGSGIDLSSVGHVATYNPKKEQMEIFARFGSRQTVEISPLKERYIIDSGELVNTEISRKFRLHRLIPQLERFNFDTEKVFIDEREWFALILMRRVDQLQGPGRPL
ncbi:MAG TPA: L-histidine N(alpha)-methyltransferase [Desulfuromonadaceae bacterium]|jgi:L-histidine N-alpha-methyltransferase